jgi:membrane protease YdiL (CAAX protease family)
MASARTVLGFIFQALAVALFFRGSADPWNESAPWWRVYGTLVDVGCLVLLVWLTRREGLRLFDLGNYRRKGWLRNVGIGVGIFVPGFLLTLGTLMGVWALLGYSPPATGAGLPLWSVLYSLIIWPIIWSPTEEFTYTGYCLPRAEALTGKKWLALVVGGFFLILQHVFFPIRSLAWQEAVGWIASLVPTTVIFGLIYLRWRRLLPFQVAHYLTDVASVLLASFMAGLGG